MLKRPLRRARGRAAIDRAYQQESDARDATVRSGCLLFDWTHERRVMRKGTGSGTTQQHAAARGGYAGSVGCRIALAEYLESVSERPLRRVRLCLDELQSAAAPTGLARRSILSRTGGQRFGRARRQRHERERKERSWPGGTTASTFGLLQMHQWPKCAGTSSDHRART